MSKRLTLSPTCEEALLDLLEGALEDLLLLRHGVVVLLYHLLDVALAVAEVLHVPLQLRDQAVELEELALDERRRLGPLRVDVAHLGVELVTDDVELAPQLQPQLLVFLPVLLQHLDLLALVLGDGLEVVQRLRDLVREEVVALLLGLQRSDPGVRRLVRRLDRGLHTLDALLDERGGHPRHAAFASRRARAHRHRLGAPAHGRRRKNASGCVAAMPAGV